MVKHKHFYKNRQQNNNKKQTSKTTPPAGMFELLEANISVTMDL